MKLMRWIAQLPQWLVWGLVLPLIVLNGWLLLLVFDYFRSPISVFITANLLAFLLDYPVRWLQRRRISRPFAIAIVFLSALSFLLILGVTIVPLVLGQLNDLVNRLPVWIESGSRQLESLQSWAIARRLPLDFSRLALQIQDSLSSRLQVLSGELLGVGIGLVGSALDFILTIVITFYLLLQGTRLWDGIFEWFPNAIGFQLRKTLRQNFHNYFVGQASLAALMGISMILAFLVLRLPFGLLFGLAIGLMTLFPFGAPFGICVISFLVSLNSFWLGVKVLIAATFIDQSIENAIAPRLLGHVIGLNPVWVLIALLIGVRLGGLLGLLIAVPLAGFIKATVDQFRDRTIATRSDSI